MRLTSHEQEVIKSTAHKMFGDDVQVWLFGSRVDDDARGGDIDLFLQTPGKLENRAMAAFRYNAELQMQLGLQKIDVLLADAATKRQPIHEIALKTGIRL